MAGRLVVDGSVFIADTLYADSIAALMTASDTTAILTMAAAHDTIFYGPTASGSGANTVTIWAVDTAGTDSAVTGVMVAVRSLAGVLKGALSTTGSGTATFSLDNDSFLVLGSNLGGYTWNIDTIVVSGALTDTITGYNWSMAEPGTPNVCRVYGYAYDITADSTENADVIFTLTGQVNDTCNNLIMSSFATETETDASGEFSQDLIWSSCLGGAKYTIKVKSRHGVSRTKTFTVPDSTTHLLIW
jgi:hypothetical protein